MVKILVAHLAYPFTMASYFLRALDRREDVEIKTVGAFYDDWLPWNGGMKLPRQYIRPVDFPLPRELMHPNWRMVKPMLGDWKPDLVLQIDAGWHFSDKPDVLTATVATDPHVLNYDLPRAYSDYFFNMQKFYSRPNDIYLPYAYDPTVHYSEQLSKKYDACLIGLHYDNRTALVNGLRANGRMVYYGIGEIYDEARRLYSQSAISLCWSSMQDLPARFFEGMAYRTLLLSNRIQDSTLHFVRGSEFVEFDSIPDAIEKVNYYLAHPDEMKQIAEAGYNAVKSHTWDARVQTILETVGLCEKASHIG